MKAAFLALALVLAAGLGAAEPAPLSPTAAPGPEAFLPECGDGLDAELSYLDGGTLTQALRALAQTGAPLRLLLDPTTVETRREGAALARLTPSTQVHWLEGAGKPLRRLVGRHGQWAWRAGQSGSRADGARDLAAQRFEAAWAAAAAALPEGLALEDELSGMPDPSEGQPRIIRRKEAGAQPEESETESHADPADQGREATPEAVAQP